MRLSTLRVQTYQIDGGLSGILDSIVGHLDRMICGLFELLDSRVVGFGNFLERLLDKVETESDVVL